ncbi:retrovirus-related pol polyprotein from transposon TNT 1-94 [Tanacetum coccineum]
MSLMIMKNSISVAIRGAIPSSKNAKEFLKLVEEQFKGSSKANVSTLILKMLTTKHDGLSGVREHIMMIYDMASKLNGMDMAISEERSKGYRVYCPNHTTRIVETRDAEFLENGEISRSGERNIDLNEILMDAPNQESERNRRHVVHDDFITYLNEDDYNLGKIEDPIFYKDAINSNQSTRWLKAMNDELKSIQINDVWELTELPNGIKPIGCKWVYKTKLDPKENIKRYKAHLVAKGYTQMEGID